MSLFYSGDQRAFGEKGPEHLLRSEESISTEKKKNNAPKSAVAQFLTEKRPLRWTIQFATSSSLLLWCLIYMSLVTFFD